MITLEHAMNIIKNNEAFYFKEEILPNGEKFRFFNYRLASYNDFVKDKNALELRGLCFNLETGERWFGLHKFFNDGENPFTMDEYCPWNDNDNIEVTEKLDGSLILPTLNKNKQLFLRSKSSFMSIQVQMANQFVQQNKHYTKFILDMLNEGLYPIFEGIGYENQIVVPYNNPFELVLIQIRKLDTGEYLTYSEIKKLMKKYPDINYVKKVNYKLKDLRKLQETMTGIEGWIARNLQKPYEHQFRKIKTKWYYSLHRLLSPNELVENKIIEHIICETIDDILANIHDERRKKVEEIIKKVNHYFNHSMQEIIKLYKIKQNMNRKDFALKYGKHPFFGIVMMAKNEDKLDKLLKNKILKDTKKLSKAKSFLKNINNI